MASPSTCPHARILIVDDEPLICNLLAAILRKHGYVCRTCGSANEAWALLRARPFELVITDYQLPGRSGLELLARARTRYPHVAFLMATGANDVTTAVAAMRAGAFDYLLKPLQPARVLQAVAAALAESAARAARQHEAERVRDELEQMLLRRTQELGGALARVQECSTETLHFIAAALDARAQEVAGHSLRVCRYSLELARRMNYTAAELDRIERGAQLHDIGKLGVPDAILNKPGPLTPEETRIMRGHVAIGVALVRRVPSLRSATPVILAHHERFDGAGYPHGLAQESIPMDARVFAIADTLDAITSHRPYRRAQSWDMAHQEILRQAGSQFDPRAVRAFLDTPRQRWLELQQG